MRQGPRMTLTKSAAECEVISVGGRGRRPRVLALLSFLALLAAVVAVGFTLATYVPLEHGSGSVGFGRDSSPGLDITTDETIRNSFGTEFRVIEPEAGTGLVLVFGLLNSGRLPVEIVDVGLPLPDYYFSKKQAFASDAPGGSGLPYTSLQSFTLKPGASRDVGVRIAVTGCPDGPAELSAGTISTQHVPVTWRFLGVTRVSQVPLSFAASLTAFPQCRL